MRRLLLPLALLVTLVPASLAKRTPSNPTPRHVIAVELDPAAGTLEGTDTLTLAWSRSVEIRMHEALEVRATCDGRALAIEPAASGEAGLRQLRLPASCRGEDGLATIEISMKGRIVDPVKDEPSLHFVTGDRTSGLIVEEGAFLAGGTGWYAETGDLALFELSVTVPPGWSAVSQGDAGGVETLPDGRRTFRHASKIPTDGLAMSAGPYVIDSVEHEGVTISTWFWAEEQSLSQAFLDAAKTEISRLTRLLGPYPGTKFDIVENFFTTGYGFPTYTLLGRDVIRMGPRALRPGYLDHEIAHVWFGNHVNVDVPSGNWCEGLTSYVTNYLNTAAGGEPAALEARQRISQRYSVDVPPARDFAPRDFVSKTDDAGASVGYGKVSMIFHALARDLGEEVFRSALKDFVQRFGGRRASWSDIRDSFERVSGRELDATFEQWVDRAGLPQLALRNVRDEGGVVRGEVAQEGLPYTLTLDLEVTTVNGTTVAKRIDVAGPSTPFSVEIPAHAQRVRLDPGFHVPRRVAPEDLPPSLARTLAGDPLLVVVPDAPGGAAGEGERERHGKLVALAEMAAAGRGKVMTNKEAARIEVESSSVLMLGATLDNGWMGEMAAHFEQTTGVDLRGSDSFRAGNRRFRDAGASLLASAPHPKKPGATISAWVPLAHEGLDSGRMIFFYGWDSWAAIEGGRARARATTWPESSATSVILAQPAAPGTPGARMRQTIDALVRDDFEGRAAGIGAPRVGNWLADRLQELGLQPFGERGWMFPFGFTLQDMPGTPSLALRSEGPEKPRFLPVLPATGWLPAPAVGVAAAELGLAEEPRRLPVVIALPEGLVFAGGPRPRFEGLDLKNAAAVVRDDGGEGAVGRIVTAIDEAKRRNAAALIVLRPEATWPGEPGLVISPTHRNPADAERLATLEKSGGLRAVQREAAIDRARLPSLPRHGNFPLFFAGREVAAALEAVGGLKPGARSFRGQGADLRLSVALERLRDNDVLGLVPAAGGRMDRAIMLSAHHDALGEAADGTFQQGAADDAAGVAVVLEVAARLAQQPAALPVIVTFFSAKEWGLQGSRVLAENWGGSRPDLAAVVNVDSVGHAGAQLHVVGRSREPVMAAQIDEAARAAGLDVGGSIDDVADRDGSDHWPWVAGGIPAISLFQADFGRVGTPQDTADALDTDTLEGLADALEAAVRRIAEGG